MVAEGVRDIFGRIFLIDSQHIAGFNLWHILSFPHQIPPSLACSDGPPLKTEKSTPLRTLESRRVDLIMSATLPRIDTTVIDGGFLLHRVLPYIKWTDASMAKERLTKVCAALEGKSISEKFQGEHEEADTAFHTATMAGNVWLRASDSDIPINLLGMLGRSRAGACQSKNYHGLWKG